MFNYSWAGKCEDSPNLFTLMKYFEPNSTTGAFYSWKPMAEILKPKEYLNASELSLIDDESWQKSLDYFKSHLPKLLFIYTDEIDETGHRFGFERHYHQAIIKTDQWIGELLNLLTKLNFYDRSQIYLVSDHGRKLPFGSFHGSFTTGEVQTFYLAAGQGIKKNYHLKSLIMNYDLSPTILYTFGYSQPLQMHSKPIFEQFEGYQVNINLASPPLRNKSNTIWFYKEQSAEYMQNKQACLIKYHPKENQTWLFYFGNWDWMSYFWGIASTVLLQVIIFLLYKILINYKYAMKRYLLVK